VSAIEQRPAVAAGELAPPVVAVEPAGAPAVVDGEVTRVIEIEPYPNASTAAGGCTSLTGTYVVDPDEIAAIHSRVRWGQ
jgi:hypothetical protein